MIDVKFTPLTLNQAHELSLPVVSRTNTDNSSRMPKNYVQAGVDFNVDKSILIPKSLIEI